MQIDTTTVITEQQIEEKQIEEKQIEVKQIEETQPPLTKELNLQSLHQLEIKESMKNAITYHLRRHPNIIKNFVRNATAAPDDQQELPYTAECMICYQVIDEPVRCKNIDCDVIFCKECVTKLEQQVGIGGKKCPSCRKLEGFDRLARSNKILLDMAKVRCKNYRHCQWQGTYSKLREHIFDCHQALNDCESELMAQSFAKCDLCSTWVEKSLLKSHQLNKCTEPKQLKKRKNANRSSDNLNQDIHDFYIFVKGAQSTQTLFLPRDSNICEIKLLLEDLQMIPVNRQRLMYNAKVLEDGRSLIDYNIQKGAYVNFLLRNNNM